MFVLSHTVPVNPPGVEPVLTRDQVWRGLVLKAENAVPFVPGMEYCRVIDTHADGLTREVSFRGQAMRERVTYAAPVQVRFDRIDRPGAAWVTNTISDSAQGLLLSFTFAVAFDGVAEGSAAERERGEAMRSAYVAAVDATLGTVRTLAAEGRLGGGAASVPAPAPAPAPPPAPSHRERFLHFLDCYARKDIAGIARLLAPDATLRDWNIAVRGHAAVEAATQQNFDDAETIAIEVLQLHEGPRTVAGELRIVVDGHVELFVVDVIEFDAESRVKAIRAFKGRGD